MRLMKSVMGIKDDAHAPSGTLVAIYISRINGRHTFQSNTHPKHISVVILLINNSLIVIVAFF